MRSGRRNETINAERWEYRWSKPGRSIPPTSSPGTIHQKHTTHGHRPSPTPTSPTSPTSASNRYQNNQTIRHKGAQEPHRPRAKLTPQKKKKEAEAENRHSRLTEINTQTPQSAEVIGTKKSPMSPHATANKRCREEKRRRENFTQGGPSPPLPPLRPLSLFSCLHGIKGRRWVGVEGG